MSRKKLTLSVDEEAIRKARRYSRRRGTSISELVSRFLAGLDDEETSETPTVAKLRGILPSDTTVEEYRQHLLKKHGE